MIKKENLILIAEAMKHRDIVRLVEKESSIVGAHLPDVTSFEHTCYVNIGKELLKGESKKSSIIPMAYRYIKRAASRHVGRVKYKPPANFSSLAIINNDGEEMEFEIEDVLANIEDRMVEEEAVNEKAALLAKGDSRRLAILNAWTSGEFNDLEISRVLAHSFGGKVETHRKFIGRFRTECQERLVAVS